MTGEVRFHDLDAGWWFQLDREHDTIALYWVASRGAWVGGAGPLGGPVNLSQEPLVWLPEPEDQEDAERIAREHFAAVTGRGVS